MFGFEVNYTSAKRVEEALRGLDETLQPAAHSRILRKLGNTYLADTVKRFENQHDPDRKPWKALRPVTIKHKTHGYQGRSASVAEPERRGVWTSDLLNSLTFRVEGNSVIIGSNEEHAKYFHFGTKKLKKLNGNKKTPWGPIQSRRFLGRNTRIDSKILKLYSDEISKEIGIKATF